MGKYLIRGNYVGDGVKGLMAEGGSKRRDAAKAAVESVGGSMDCMYYAFGDTDVYAVADIPDDATATALSLMINASGAVSVNLTPLMTPEDIDAAAAKTPSYRPPGG
ncbi:MAG: GYD domain-containing protein [Ilumatobacter sp.]|nr:GYD domain-containing protein [Ilumatobacter sp.]